MLPISEVPGHVYTCAVEGGAVEGVSGNEVGVRSIASTSSHDSGNDVNFFSLCDFAFC